MFGSTKQTEALIDNLKDQIIELRVMLQAERVLSMDLTAELVRMKREGFVPVPAVPPMSIPTLPDAIRAALAEIPEEARGETERWAWMHLGEDPELLAAHIRAGA